MRYSNRIYGIIGTVVFHGLLLLVLLFCFLKEDSDKLAQWPPVSENLIEAEELEPLYDAGEYVRTGDVELPTPDDSPAPAAETSDVPTQPGADAQNAGHAADPTPTPVTRKTESPMKVKETPKGPTKEQLDAEKRKQEAKKQQEAKQAADSKVKGAFGKSGSGKAGQTNGNSESGAMEGLVGSNVEGRSLEHWVSVRSTQAGRVAIRVSVASDGSVTSASYQGAGSSGNAGASPEIRRRCEQAALKCRFSRKEGSRPASGTIIFNFR